MGDVTISGAKNAAVAILPACLLVNDRCRIENLPDIKDVKLFLKILENLGAEVCYIDNNTVEIDCSDVDSYKPLGELTRRMRGSSYLMGALLGRFNRFSVDPPGGCDFGTRPIDMHIKCFELMGATVDTSRGIGAAKADKLKGAHVFFDIVSVGAVAPLKDEHNLFPSKQTIGEDGEVLSSAKYDVVPATLDMPSGSTYDVDQESQVPS